VWIVGGIVLFLCLIVTVIAAVRFLPDLLGGEAEEAPTTTPAPPTTTPAPPTATPTVPPSPTLTNTLTSEMPTATPPMTPSVALPAFAAQVSLVPSAPQVHPDELLTVTVTLFNTGGVALGNLHYELLGWEPAFVPVTDVSTPHDVEVPPDGNDQAVFVLRAVQPGIVELHSNVTFETRTDLPTVESVESPPSVVAVAQ